MAQPNILAFKSKFKDGGEKAANIENSLVNRLKNDLTHSKQKDGNVVQFFMYFFRFTLALPPLDGFPDLFKQQYVISVCDLDMKNDLQRVKVINWCSASKKVYPLKTTGDGNCLLHAISLGMWGIEDTTQFLRRCLYFYLVTLCEGGSRSTLQRRYLYHVKQLQEQQPQSFNVNISSADQHKDLEDIIRAASDIQLSNTTAKTPFATLEGIHLFALANFLRRPIILLAEKTARSVFGESMQENNLRGIYLPLEWDSSTTERCPLILAYNLNHFCPLVMQKSTAYGEGNDKNILPIVMADMTLLPVRFLLHEEESNVLDILNKYLKIRNAQCEVNGLYQEVKCVVIECQEIFDELDIVTAHRENCESLFYEYTMAIQGSLFSSVDPGRRITNQATNKHDPSKCILPNCDMFGSPATGNMCSKCHMEYTKKFAEEEATKKGHHLVQNPSAPPLPYEERIQSGFDLSLMGEKCERGCGNFCSVYTFPYCHQCSPKNQHPVQQEEASAAGIVITPTSMEHTKISYPPPLETVTQGVEDKPYKHIGNTSFNESMTGSVIAQPEDSGEELAVAPMIPVETPLAITQTSVISSENSKEEEDEKTLFGEGGEELCTFANEENSNISTAAKTNLELQIPPDRANNGEEGNLFSPLETAPPLSLGNGPSSQTYVVGAKYQANLSSSSEGTPSPNCNQNINFALTKSSENENSELRNQSTVEIDPTVNNQRTDDSNKKEVEPRSQEAVKNLCSKPGCKGTRNKNPHNYCMKCWKEVAKTDIPLDNTLEESCTPTSLSTKEKEEIKPIVTSSKDKVECAWHLCKKKIYPPKKLCDDCQKVLNDNYNKDRTTSRSKEHTVRKHQSPNATQTSRPMVARLCIEPGCDRYGDPGMLERCTDCFYKARNELREVVPPPAGGNYIPPSMMTPDQVQRYNIAEQQLPIAGYHATQEIGRNLDEPMRNVSGTSQTYPRTVTQGRREDRQRVHTVPVQVRHGRHTKISTAPVQTRQPTEFELKMQGVVNNLKSSRQCKTQTCTNFANPKNQGYCNGCFRKFTGGSMSSNSLFARGSSL